MQQPHEHQHQHQTTLRPMAFHLVAFSAHAYTRAPVILPPQALSALSVAHGGLQHARRAHPDTDGWQPLEREPQDENFHLAQEEQGVQTSAWWTWSPSARRSTTWGPSRRPRGKRGRRLRLPPIPTSFLPSRTRWMFDRKYADVQQRVIWGHIADSADAVMHRSCRCDALCGHSADIADAQCRMKKSPQQWKLAM